MERPDERELALRAMRVILGGTSRAAELEQLARRRLIEQSVENALFWQPWPTVGVDRASCAKRQLALSANRPVLLSTCHLGPYFLNMSTFSSLGLSPIAVSAPWFFASPSADYWGRRLARWRQGLSERGQRLACSANAFPVIRALLEQGEIVLNYFDIPGSSRMRFLGKPVMLTGGSARLAFETDALILPLRARRAGNRVWTDFSAPLDPRAFAGTAQLQEALARVHERWVLELPHTLEDPNRAGAWEQGASEPRMGATEPNIDRVRRTLSARPVLQRGQPRQPRDGAGAARAGASRRAARSRRTCKRASLACSRWASSRAPRRLARLSDWRGPAWTSARCAGTWSRRCARAAHCAPSCARGRLMRCTSTATRWP